MRRPILLLCAALLMLAVPGPAAADITAFIGITPTPENRALRGFAFGFGLLIVGFEFEYANTVEDEIEGLAGLQTASGNMLVQTPIEIAGTQFYATAGGGLYRERLLSQQETS